jgi:hypothetical protein
VNIDYTRDIAQKFGLQAALHDIAYRAANRLTDVMLLRGMTIAMDTVDPEYLKPQEGRWGFMARELLLDRVRAQESDMTEDFIHDAIAQGDRCYGVLHGDTLASYGWYATRPTPIDDDLTLHFDPAWAYMYKGFTLPAYRGKRLHGFGMARALAALSNEGSAGLISYVRSNNFPSLKSCYRMGYRDFGQLFAAKFNGQHITYASKGCKAFDFRIEVAGPSRAVSQPAARGAADRAAA